MSTDPSAEHLVPSAPRSGYAYMPQLDGLRALAVSGVIVSHFIPAAGRFVNTGGMGVRLFFVLSGFLITGILLAARTPVDSGERTIGDQLRRFYLRRFLRLFPALALVIACAWIAGVPEMRRSVWWHLSYLSNVYFARIGHFDGAVSQLWSLAVEEQFYLFWPLLLFLIPRRHLAATVIAMTAVGPSYRLLATVMGANPIAVSVLPFACFDTLGFGAMLAISGRTELGAWWTRAQLERAGTVIGLPLLVLLALLRLTQRANGVQMVVGDLVMALAFVAIISKAAAGYGGRAGALLQSRALVYVGRISYGVYLYHDFAPRMLAAALRTAGLDPARAFWPVSAEWTQRLHANEITTFMLLCAITLAVASLSWRFFEHPINLYRDRFEDRRATPSPLVAVARA
jgi:peptidoglycan/LPS O-acetylase OafA/YrhL